MNAQRHDESTSLATGASRRAVLRGLGAGGLAALLAAGGRTSAGAEAAALQPGPGHRPPALSTWVAAWEARDPDRIAAAYAEDGVYEDAALGHVLSGPAEIRRYLAAFFEAFADAELRVTAAFAADDLAAATWALTAHFVGELPAPPPGGIGLPLLGETGARRLPAGSGQEVTVRGAVIFALASGAVRQTTTFYDLYGILIEPVAEARAPLPAPPGREPVPH
jgi:uncharacterized protein (TIGR02246 family)